VLRQLEREHEWRETPSWLARLPDQALSDATQSLTTAEYRSWARTGFSTDDRHLPARWVIRREAGEVLQRFVSDLDRPALDVGLAQLGMRLEPRLVPAVSDQEARVRGHLVVAPDGRKAQLSQIDREASAALLHPEVVRAARQIRHYAELDELHAEAHRLATLLGTGILGRGRTQVQVDEWATRLQEVNRRIGSGRLRRDARAAVHAALNALPPTNEARAVLRRHVGTDVLARTAEALPDTWRRALDTAREEAAIRRPEGLVR
jgi:hypothetical protein